jgi:hypothetical protein
MMRWTTRTALAMSAAMMFGTGLATAANDTALSASELARCANQVERLRTESARLTQWNTQLDVRRDLINARAADLDKEAATIPKDDLKRGLDYVDRRKAHQAEAIKFNAEIDQIRKDIAALNVVKDEYDRNCADRSYRRSDLDALPAGPRTAMQAGLQGVAVPYIDPAASGLK